MELSPADLIFSIEGKKFPKPSSSVALIHLENKKLNIIFDIGAPYEKIIIQRTLEENNLTPDDINFIILSHWHIDHIGTLDLFKKAKIIISSESYDILNIFLKAISMVKGAPNPIKSMTNLLIDQYKSDIFLDSIRMRYKKIYAIAGMIFHNANLIEQFNIKCKNNKLVIVDREDIVLFNSIHIMKFHFHTKGDLVTHIINKEGKNIFLTGDIMALKRNIIRIRDQNININLKNITTKGNYVLPGHDKLFLC